LYSNHHHETVNHWWKSLLQFSRTNWKAKISYRRYYNDAKTESHGI